MVQPLAARIRVQLLFSFDQKKNLAMERKIGMDDSTNTFKDKWEHNKGLAFEETLRQGSDIHSWILERNGFRSGEEMIEYLKDKRRILDAGCGNGRVTALLRKYAPDTTEIVGVDLISTEIARENLDLFHLSHNVRFFEGDLDRKSTRLNSSHS